jgi:hypothetical protein
VACELLIHGLSAIKLGPATDTPAPAIRIPRACSEPLQYRVAQPTAYMAMIEAGSLIMIYCIVINEQLSSTRQGEQNTKSTETNDEWNEGPKEIGL